MAITNASIKTIKKLKDKKYRKSEGLFLVEGRKACEELVKSNFTIRHTLSSSLDYQNLPNFELVDYEVLKSIATTETPQDIVCVVEIPPQNEETPIGNSLILDNLQDAGNVGTLIRSAVAFNFRDIYLIETADVFSEKVIRASMGAIFKANLHFVNRDYIINFKSKICDTLIGTDLKSKPFSEIKPKKRIGVIIGNEGNGVKQELLDCCDEKLTLDMNSEIESLNAGVAGSIIMYEFFTR